MSCCYLCSSNIFAMINYVGFATWVRLNTNCLTRSFFHYSFFLSSSPLVWLCSACPTSDGSTQSGRGRSRWVLTKLKSTRWHARYCIMFSSVKYQWPSSRWHVTCFLLGEPHLPYHLCPLLDLCDPCAHDCFSRGDRFPISFLRNFLYFDLLGIGCAIIFTGVPVYFIIVSDDYVKKPEYVRRLLGKASLITTAWIFNSSPCNPHPIPFQESFVIIEKSRVDFRLFRLSCLKTSVIS